MDPSLLYREERHVLQGGGRYIQILPARRGQSLPEATVTARIAAAAANFSGAAEPEWLLNFSLTFRTGTTAQYPRRLGVSVDRIREVLAEKPARMLALSIWSDGDRGDPTGPITSVTVRVFRRAASIGLAAAT